MRPAVRKPRIAIVSPWPPQGSGIADYALRLVQALLPRYDVDAYHDPHISPDLASVGSGVTAIPAPLLLRLWPLRGYRGVIYQMGNSRYHEFMYGLMLGHPGIVTLHDYRLGHFHEGYGRRLDVAPGHVVREIAHDRPSEIASVLRDWPTMQAERGGLPVALAARAIDMNRRVFERSRAVVLHSRWALDRARSLLPEQAHQAHRIPFGTTVESITPEQRAAIRDRLGLPREALVFASLGFLGWGKMNVEAIEAFARATPGKPDALFVFMGTDLDDGRAARRAEELGIAHRVHFLGRRSIEDFQDLAAVADIGVNLRRSPTNGETSASLFDFLRWGTPTIVTDVDAFGDEPDGVVARVRWQAEGLDGLARMMRRLVDDAVFRDRIRKTSREHLRRHHQWSDIGEQYAALIEEVHTRRREAI